MKSLIFTLLVLGSSIAFSQTADNTPANGAKNSGSDKLDIKKLEQKYWSAKDDDFAVVQNRRYTKAGRFFLSADAGVPFNDAFSSGTLLGVNFGYFFNERWGMDFEYKGGSLSDNDATSQFVSHFGVYPDHNVFVNSKILSAVFVPFYAKMSFMDRSIIYFDMGLELGAGTTSYKIKQVEGDITDNAPTVKMSVFQQIFFSEHFALRADLANTWTNEQKDRYYLPGSTIPISGGGSTTISNDPRDLGKHTINDTSLMFGLTYWF